MRVRRTFLVLALLGTGCTHVRAQTVPATPPAAPRVELRAAARLDATADTAALRRAIDALVDAHRGVVGYSVTNLETGEHLERRGDETFSTASLIKVPVLVTLFDLAEKKQLTLDDPVVLTELDRVGGAGELQFLRTPLTLRLWDVAWLMSTLSDNTATNLILDRIKIRRVWRKMEALGLPHTKVHSGSMDRIATVAPDSSAKYGLGVTTPNEMARLFTLLAQGQAVSPAADSTMLWILRHNQDETKLARFTYDVRLAHKTGDVDQSRTDCGVFYLPARVVTCVLTKENVDKRYWTDSEGNAVIARIGEAVVKAWRR
ncbi:MAG: class A beta-lactamase-related serine hydrolase [Gemmatimonadota bacterium]|nr:class A beta-lactamase-related serine hydrolase [Gemmatimonadota bacterium]